MIALGTNKGTRVGELLQALVGIYPGLGLHLAPSVG